MRAHPHPLSFLAILLSTLCAPALLPAAELKPRQPDATIEIAQGTTIHAAALSPDARFAYVHATLPAEGASAKHPLLEINLRTRATSRTITPDLALPEPYQTERMRLVLGGRSLLISASRAGESAPPLRLLDLASGKVTREFDLKDWSCTSNGWEPGVSPDGNTLYTNHALPSEEHQQILARDLATGKELRRLTPSPLGNQEKFCNIKFFPRGDQLVAAQIVINSNLIYDALIQRWSGPDNQPAASWRIKGLYNYCAPDPPPVYIAGQRVYAVTVAGVGSRITVFDLQTGKSLQTIDAPAGVIISRVQTTTDQRLLLAGGVKDPNALLAVYDLQKNKWIDLLDSLAFGRDGLVVPTLTLSKDQHTLLAIHPRKNANGAYITGNDYLAVFDLSRYFKRP